LLAAYNESVCASAASCLFPCTTLFRSRELREFKGVSVIIYDQTCATEKRRRRKRGKLEDPAKRAFINPAVCEGCGDCGEKSNCLDRKSTRLNSSHVKISYAVFCLKKTK